MMRQIIEKKFLEDYAEFTGKSSVRAQSNWNTFLELILRNTRENLKCICTNVEIIPSFGGIKRYSSK